MEFKPLSAKEQMRNSAKAILFLLRSWWRGFVQYLNEGLESDKKEQ